MGCGCKEEKDTLRPSIYSQELPPWPTLEEIRKVVRDEVIRGVAFELKKAGVI